MINGQIERYLAFWACCMNFELQMPYRSINACLEHTHLLQKI